MIKPFAYLNFLLLAFGLSAQIKIEVNPETPPINIVRFIAPRRGADEGIDLWKVLNVCQEKLLEGRFYDLKGRRIRRLQNVDRIVKVNQGLFKLALEYAA